MQFGRGRTIGGFRRGRGCRDQIVSLILPGHIKVALKDDGFLAAFIDSSKAYDRACRKTLWGLRGYGVKGRFLSCFRLYTYRKYNGSEVEIKRVTISQ